MAAANCNFVRRWPCNRASASRVVCGACEGSGVSGMASEEPVPECGPCYGKGKRQNLLGHYPLDAADVTEWVAFLQSCGAFNVY